MVPPLRIGYKCIMSLSRSSSAEIRYLVGLTAPQQQAALVERIRRKEGKRGRIPDPFPPMIPIFESPDPVSPPVPGLLPPCTSPLIPGKLPMIEESSGVSFLPVESEGWLDHLSKALAKTAALHTGVEEKTLFINGFPELPSLRLEPLYPPFRGVPLSFPSAVNAFKEREAADFEASEPPSGWRVLFLECFRVDYIIGRPWFLSAAWSSQWCRRLRRAPPLSSAAD